MQMNDYLKSQYAFLVATEDDAPRSLSKTTTRRGDPICPAAQQLFDPESLQEMIETAKDFHQRGGNLVSIENYLNGEMQQTLDRLDIHFEFNEPQQETTGGEQSKTYKNTTKPTRFQEVDMANHSLENGRVRTPIEKMVPWLKKDGSMS